MKGSIRMSPSLPQTYDFFLLIDFDLFFKILDKMKKFRFRKEKNNAAIIFKLDMETMDVQIEDEIEDIEDVEELQNELPHLQPRFIMYSCK